MGQVRPERHFIMDQSVLDISERRSSAIGLSCLGFAIVETLPRSEVPELDPVSLFPLWVAQPFAHFTVLHR